MTFSTVILERTTVDLIRKTWSPQHAPRLSWRLWRLFPLAFLKEWCCVYVCRQALLFGWVSLISTNFRFHFSADRGKILCKAQYALPERFGATSGCFCLVLSLRGFYALNGCECLQAPVHCKWNYGRLFEEKMPHGGENVPGIKGIERVKKGARERMREEERETKIEGRDWDRSKA